MSLCTLRRHLTQAIQVHISGTQIEGILQSARGVFANAQDNQRNAPTWALGDICKDYSDIRRIFNEKLYVPPLITLPCRELATPYDNFARHHHDYHCHDYYL